MRPLPSLLDVRGIGGAVFVGHGLLGDGYWPYCAGR
jgi:hypothetical protein